MGRKTGPAQLAADAVDDTKLADNAVVTAKIGDDQVTTVKIADENITTDKLSATTTPTAKTIADPGDGVAIPVTGNGDVALTIGSAGAETNTLAVPTFAGQIMTISADTVGTGTRVITVADAVNAAGEDTITFSDAGDFISLYGIKLGASFAWRVLAIDGAVLS